MLALKVEEQSVDEALVDYAGLNAQQIVLPNLNCVLYVSLPVNDLPKEGYRCSQVED